MKLLVHTIFCLGVSAFPLTSGAQGNVPVLVDRTPVFNPALGRELATLPAHKASSADAAASLIRRGANPDFVDHCRPLLSDATSQGNADLVRVLLVEGNANPNLEDCGGESAITQLFEFWDAETAVARTEILDLLLEHDADPVVGAKSFGRRALHLGAEKPSAVDAVVRLLRHGVDVNLVARSSFRDTPLSLAAYSGELETMEVLVDHGANVEPVPVGGGSLRTASPLLAAIDAQVPEKVAYLLQKGASANLKATTRTRIGFDYEGRPLILATCLGQAEIVQMLVESGADLTAIHHPLYKTTALDVAVINGHLDIVNRLLEAGAQPSGYTRSYICSRDVLERLCSGDLWDDSEQCQFLETGAPFPVTCPEPPTGCE